MEKKRRNKINPRLRRQRGWAALLVALVWLGGGAALWQVADTMAAETRCGQVFAAITPQEGVLEFTLLGREGAMLLLASRRRRTQKACVRVRRWIRSVCRREIGRAHV